MPPFSPLSCFVKTMEVGFHTFAVTYRDIVNVLEPAGAVKALNSNFGHKCQPGYEEHLKAPAAAPPAQPPRRRRCVQGDGTSFQSAIEAVIIPRPEEFPDGDAGGVPYPQALRDIYASRPRKVYKIKTFPSTGHTQIPGVLADDSADGEFVAQVWAQFLSDQGVGLNNEPFTTTERPFILRNYKFQIIRPHTNMIIDTEAFTEFITRLKAHNNDNLKIWEIKAPQDNQNMSFRVSVGDDGKKMRFKLFFRGKVNILGAKQEENVLHVYNVMSRHFREHWDTFVQTLPEPDDDLEDPPFSSEDALGVQVDPDDVEDDEEDALHDGAPGSGTPPLDGARKLSDDVVGENVAGDEDEDQEQPQQAFERE